MPMRPLADDHPRSEADEPGMGEILEGHFAQPGVSGVTRHRTPGLGIDFMQVEDSDLNERRYQRGRIALRGVIIFIVFDLLVLGWIGWARVKKWWTYEPQVIHKAVPVPDASREAGNDTFKQPATEANSATSGLTSPQHQLGTKPGEAPVIGTGSAPSDGSAKAKPSDALPAEVPKVPPTPPPPPDVIHREAPPEAPKQMSESAAVIKAIPIPADPTAKMETPAEPAGKKEEQVSHSDKAVAAMVAKIGTSFNPLESATMPLTNEPLPAVNESSVPAEAIPAQKAAKAFLSAATWEERLKWCQRPDAIKAAMETHYKSHPDGPIAFTSLEFMQRFPAKEGLPAYCMFEVKGPSLPHPVLLLVDQPAKKDPQIDWECFVEFQYDTLNRFFAAQPSDASRFRVVVRRRHAFEKTVPDLDAKDSFEVSHPGSGETFPVYVARKSETGRDLANRLPWNSDLAVIVELVWNKETVGKEWVELRQVVANGWKP
jgi:hypothetical protein